MNLLGYTARILDLNPRAFVSDDLTPSLAVELAIRGNVGPLKEISVTLRDSTGQTVKNRSIPASELSLEPDMDREIVHWSLEKDKVCLWWPTGYGSQDLYEIEVKIFGEVRLKKLVIDTYL